jgi:hypothetical protein
MALTTRLLPRDSWVRLIGTEAESVWPHLPEDSKVIVVEDGDVIVGCWVLIHSLHAECVWVSESYRPGGSVARRLWVTMHKIASSLGMKGIFTSAVDDRVRQLLEHHGAMKLPGDHFMIPVQSVGDTSCQQP